MNKIDGKTRICGLIGNPVEHTMSPLIHNILAEKLNHNLIYLPFSVEETQLIRAVNGAMALDYLGLNVTVPYKEKIIGCLAQVDTLAAQIGAVNTLVRTERGFKGYNTDMEGLFRALCSEQIALENEEVIILGAGGAARAVAYLCAAKQVARVYILNRTYEKAKQVADEVNEKTGCGCVYPMQLSDYNRLPYRKFLVIQTTSVGLYPDTDKAVMEEDSFYERVHTGFDLIYRPMQTRFMQLVQEHGGQAYNGLKMLLYQAIIAYELWTGVSINEGLAQEIYELLKGELISYEE